MLPFVTHSSKLLFLESGQCWLNGFSPSFQSAFPVRFGQAASFRRDLHRTIGSGFPFTRYGGLSAPGFQSVEIDTVTSWRRNKNEGSTSKDPILPGVLVNWWCPKLIGQFWLINCVRHLPLCPYGPIPWKFVWAP